MDVKILRKLARSRKWQVIYSRAKELSGLHFFANSIDFSYIQVAFLTWLELYNSVYVDLALNEDKITEDMLEDDLLIDAYLIYRRKKREEERDKTKGQGKRVSKSSKPRTVFDNKPRDMIVFKTPTKR